MHNITIIDNDLEFLNHFVKELEKYKCYHVNAYTNYEAFLKENKEIDVLFIADELGSNVHLSEKCSGLSFLTVLITKCSKAIYETFNCDIIWNVERTSPSEAILLIDEKSKKS